ncbi:YolD-like family protein [Bacillus sp. FSL K6-3431]|uniref:YolD-like family protein n=1 Tax=Bacillus sp. FSL K6-3431 TaxID=2921500 RepID=UPI0030FA0DDE
MLRDRGNKKWAGLMLPEHVAMLKEMNYDYYKTGKPSLDEYQLEEIDEKIHTAMEFHMPLSFKLWFDGFFEEIEGRIERVDEINKSVWIRDRMNDLHKIKYDSITNVDFVTD